MMVHYSTVKPCLWKSDLCRKVVRGKLFPYHTEKLTGEAFRTSDVIIKRMFGISKGPYDEKRMVFPVVLRITNTPQNF